jgi:hypothetical protein
MSFGAGAGATATQFTKVAKLSIRAAEMLNQPFTVLNTKLGKTRTGNGKVMEVAGIIGLELFERFAVKIDYASGILVLQPLATFRYSGSGAQVSISFTSDMPLVEARVDGHDGSFGIDTGNNVDLIIFHWWAVANGLIQQFHPDTSVAGSSVGGDISFVPGSVRLVHLGNQEVGPLAALLAGEHAGSLSSRSEAGNIGNKVLAHFTIIFDYRHEAMIVERAATASN